MDFVNKLNVVIVDDHKLVASLLEKQLPASGFINKINVYSSPAKFLEVYNKLDFDIIFLDIIMPEIKGDVIVEKIRADPDKANVKILILSSIIQPVIIKRLIAAGANAYLTKDAEIEEISRALKTVCESDSVYISDSVKDAFIQGYLNPKYDILLSPKEKEVLRLVCEGKSINESAEILHLSTHSIQAYIKRLFAKFEVNKTSALILKAIELFLYIPDK